MNSILTLELITRCHAGSKAKGFWDETPPKAQQLMLVVSELAESLEAHRKGRKHCCNPTVLADLLESSKRPHSSFLSCFTEWIKDSVQDELADAYIRLCDFAGGFCEADALMVWYKNGEYSYTLNPNFGGALFQLVGHICDGLMGWETIKIDQLAEVIRGIESLAEREGIDLAVHVDLKLKYNATRPVKHGKEY